MEQYVSETMQRFEADRKRLRELEGQINALQVEASRLLRMLGAYERIIKDSIGEQGFQELLRGLESANNSPSASHIDSDSETNTADLSVTDIILKVIGEAGRNGMTAAEVFSAIQTFGIGIEQRNTVYGTLSRLNTSNRIKKIGKRYFSIQN